MRRIIWVPIITILLLLNGCATMGNKQIADTGTVANIQQGKTTKAEVNALLGEPTIGTCRDDNTQVWQYFYNPLSGGADVTGNNLTIVFSRGGIVQKVSSGGGSVTN